MRTAFFRLGPAPTWPHYSRPLEFGLDLRADCDKIDQAGPGPRVRRPASSNAWNIRLLPHYAFGVFYILAHLSSGFRGVVIPHGVAAAVANRYGRLHSS